MVTIKSEREISKMRVAGKIVAEALNFASELIKEGISTFEINEKVEELILSHNALCSFKNYNGFPSGCCISINEEVIHGIPSPKKILKRGDIVSIDIGACFEGFHADAARSFIVEEPTNPMLEKLIKAARESFFAGIRNAVEGKRIADVAKSIFIVVSKNNFDVVRSFCGHGVGENLHEEPAIPNYIMNKKGIKFQKGMTLAIEPMVTLGKGDVEILDDKWTVVTKDRKASSHYENTILITDNEPEILTATGDV